MFTVIQLGNLRAHSRISKINLSGERNNLLKTAQQPIYCYVSSFFDSNKMVEVMRHIKSISQ
jgi:hypothetical protein